MTTITELRRLEEQLARDRLPCAKQEWGGADVVVSKMHPRPGLEGFYPPPRYVVTSHASELSWLFEQLRDAFYSEQMLDSCTKIEFFGRLANAANRCLQRSPDPTAHHLCAAVLHEALAIYDELQEGTFRSIGVAIGNEIADDHVDEALRTGFIGTDATLAFFKSRKVEVKRD
jgi:hypothetical protein